MQVTYSYFLALRPIYYFLFPSPTLNPDAINKLNNKLV